MQSRKTQHCYKGTVSNEAGGRKSGLRSAHGFRLGKKSQSGYFCSKPQRSGEIRFTFSSRLPSGKRVEKRTSGAKAIISLAKGTAKAVPFVTPCFAACAAVPSVQRANPGPLQRSYFTR